MTPHMSFFRFELTYDTDKQENNKISGIIVASDWSDAMDRLAKRYHYPDGNIYLKSIDHLSEINGLWDNIIEMENLQIDMLIQQNEDW